MKKITVLLPVKDTEAHLDAVCEHSPMFEISPAGDWGPSLGSIYHPRDIKVQKSSGKSKSKQNLTIGQIAVLPARDNSVVTFLPHTPNEVEFEELTQLVINHFKDLNFLLETRAEPWRKSPLEKRERDKTIWECRNLGETWEKTAELANCGVTTAKERYLYMQRSLDD